MWVGEGAGQAGEARGFKRDKGVVDGHCVVNLHFCLLIKKGFTDINGERERKRKEKKKRDSYYRVRLFYIH